MFHEWSVEAFVLRQLGQGHVAESEFLAMLKPPGRVKCLWIMLQAKCLATFSRRSPEAMVLVYFLDTPDRRKFLAGFARVAIKLQRPCTNDCVRSNDFRGFQVAFER